MSHFNYKTLDDIKKGIVEEKVEIGLDEDTSILNTSVKAKGIEIPNRIAILPMEGCDSEKDGSPSFLVTRRYSRFYNGGSGLVWWEANAVREEAKANERQMMLTSTNLPLFKEQLSLLNENAINKNGYKPVSILQLTHSGRYSRPKGHKAMPLVTQRDPILDLRSGVVSDDQVVTDEYLESLIPDYVNSAKMAREAGFDGVDIKACHRYLLSELLASHSRDGKYGGSFENRTKLILEIIREVKKSVGDDFIIASRFNVFDAHPYPYGFGEDKNDLWVYDSDEPMRFVDSIIKEGVSLLSNSAGNPYYIYPQVTRPFDLSSEGVPVPEEHQLKSIERLFKFTESVQKAAKDIPVVGNGYTWLREFAPLAGAYNIKHNRASLLGFGRQGIAYPDAANDILNNGGMKRNKCCITCSKCTQMMRDHGIDGCVIKDSMIYTPVFKKQREEAEERKKNA